MKQMWKSHKKRLFFSGALLAALVFAFGAGLGTGFTVRSASAADEPPEFGIFWEAWELVDQYFVDQENIDPARMTYGAIQGMLDTLGDQGHTVFFSPEEAKQQDEAMAGKFEGIGAYVDERDGFVYVVAPIHGSPAEAAGVLPGDLIVKVDDEEMAGLSVDDVVSRIRGPAGTDVVVTVLHEDAEEPVAIKVTRGEINIDSVTWARIPETDLVYLRISQFIDDTGGDVENALEEIQATNTVTAPVAGILLDLRNNPGGYFNEALRVNSQFLPKGQVILHERDASEKLRTYRSTGNGLAREIPMVVLINEGTASAGEITAGALQENDRAQLIGQPTLGTGTVLHPFTLSDGSVLRLGVTNWLTPDQHLIKNQGVQPDIAVEQELSVRGVDSYALEDATLEEVTDSGDLQFNKGLEELQKLVQ